MKVTVVAILFVLNTFSAFSQKLTVLSSNQKIKVDLLNQQNEDAGERYLKVSYIRDGKASEAIPRIDLGLLRSDQDFSKELKLSKAGKSKSINEQYTALHGKRSHRSNLANEVIAYFENPGKAKMNVIIRAYNDGVTFRYDFPEKGDSFIVEDEMTSYTVPDGAKRWLKKFNPANEGYYREMTEGQAQQDWAYPVLFQKSDSTCFYLLHEANMNRNYCGTKPTNNTDQLKYKLTFPIYYET
jgi:alpha-glucosidase